MSRDLPPIGVRVPPELKEIIQKSADENLRSVNAEIVFRLAVSYQNEHRKLANYSDSDLIKELMDRYGRDELYIRIGKPSAEK